MLSPVLPRAIVAFTPLRLAVQRQAAVPLVHAAHAAVRHAAGARPGGSGWMPAAVGTKFEV